jgi:hypothetical protein
MNLSDRPTVSKAILHVFQHLEVTELPLYLLYNLTILYLLDQWGLPLTSADFVRGLVERNLRVDQGGQIHSIYLIVADRIQLRVP